MTYKPQYPASPTIYKLVLLAGIFVVTGLLLYRALLIFSYNGEIGGIDNNFVYDVLRNIDRGEIYTDPSKFPYAITLYAPLYYDICTAFGKFVHINTSDPIQVYQLCRLVSLACDITTCVLLFLILRKRFRASREITLLCVACFATILCFLGYTYSRCDSLFLSFYACSFYILTNEETGKHRLKVVLLGLTSALCFFSKQNGIILPVLVIGWFIVNQNKKMIGSYFLSFILFSAILFFIHIYVLHYTYLVDNTVNALNNQLSYNWFYIYILKRLFSLWPLPLYIAIVIAFSTTRKGAGKTTKSLAVVFILQFLFAIATSLKLGSSVGYFNESFFLSFIVIINRFYQSSGKRVLNYSRKILPWASIPVFLFFLFTVVQGYLYFIQHRDQKKMVYEQQKQVRDWLQPKLQQAHVMNISSPNSDFFKVLFHKEMAVPNIDIVGCCTFPERNFDYSALLEELKDGKIAWVIAPKDLPFLSVLDIPQPQFQKDTVMNGFAIYKYK